jgi:hypothetical protein
MEEVRTGYIRNKECQPLHHARVFSMCSTKESHEQNPYEKKLAFLPASTLHSHIIESLSSLILGLSLLRKEHRLRIFEKAQLTKASLWAKSKEVA